MKKKMLGLLAAAAMILPTVGMSTVYAEGRYKAEFEESTFAGMFDVYSETVGDTPIFVRDGFIISTGRSENKILLKQPSALSAFTLEADFYPIDDMCQFSVGYYIYASGAADTLDGINAYNVQIERDYASTSAFIKIHRFEYGYKGVIAEKAIELKKLPVDMKVSANNGNVKVYVYGESIAVVDVTLPSYTPGRVGFRTFRGNAGKIGNFRVTAADLDADKSELSSLLTDARKIDAAEYTLGSKTVFEAALQTAEHAMESNVQSVIDNAVNALRAAIVGLNKNYSFADLSALIAKADEELTKSGVYTQNSIASLRSVTARAKLLTEDCASDDLSAMGLLLDNALEGLIKYIVK